MSARQCRRSTLSLGLSLLITSCPGSQTSRLDPFTATAMMSEAYMHARTKCSCALAARPHPLACPQLAQLCACAAAQTGGALSVIGSNILLLLVLTVVRHCSAAVSEPTALPW